MSISLHFIDDGEGHLVCLSLCPHLLLSFKEQKVEQKVFMFYIKSFNALRVICNRGCANYVFFLCLILIKAPLIRAPKLL